MKTLNFRSTPPRIFCSLMLFCTTFLVATGNASAAPNTVPTDLNPGDKYRLAFVTSTTRDATSSNIADYNNFVSNVAAGVPELAALGTTWSVIGSTTSVAARDNTGTNPTIATGSPIYRLDDARIATNNADLWDGSIDHPIGITETGAALSTSIYASTGMSIEGLPEPGYALGDISGVVGLGGVTYSDTHWVEVAANTTGSRYPLYAISGELSVVPEPGSIVLACFAAGGLAALSVNCRGA